MHKGFFGVKKFLGNCPKTFLLLLLHLFHYLLRLLEDPLPFIRNGFFFFCRFWGLTFHISGRNAVFELFLLELQVANLLQGLFVVVFAGFTFDFFKDIVNLTQRLVVFALVKLLLLGLE
jgi:hypothetical protein